VGTGTCTHLRMLAVSIMVGRGRPRGSCGMSLGRVVWGPGADCQGRRCAAPCRGALPTRTSPLARCLEGTLFCPASSQTLRHLRHSSRGWQRPRRQLIRL
jgi:hypothetical protein